MSGKLLGLTTSAFTLSGGVAQALLPAIILILAGQTFTTSQKGEVAVALAISGFIAQLFFTGVVEARMTARNETRNVAFPRTIAILGISAALVIAIWPNQFLLLLISLPLLFIALEVGRGVSLTQSHERREIVATLSIGISMLLALICIPISSTNSIRLLGLGVLIATAVRFFGPQPQSSPISKHTRSWLILDIIPTGALYPLLNFLVLVALGPTEAFVFAAITTASGIIGIPVTYLRTRLLRSHSKKEIYISVSAVVGASIALIVMELLGIFGILFGQSWETTATFIPLVLAMIWKILGLWAVIPLAQLRRLGEAKAPTISRIVQTLLTLVLAILAIFLHSVSLIFLALCVGETFQAVLYQKLVQRLSNTHNA